MSMTLAENNLRAVSILVVEDEALIAMEIKARLSGLGYSVVAIVDSGDRAIRSAHEHRPSLILMDVHIKGDMDGIETAKRIQASSDVPVVYLTAHSDTATVNRAKESSLFGYVLKPFEERELRVAIDMALHRHALEKRLKDSERKYAATLASIGDGVAATDPQGRITFLNAVAESLTGWRFEQVEGKQIEEVFAVIRERDGRPIDNPIRRALSENRVILLEEPTLLVSSGTDLIPVDQSAAPITSDLGETIGAVVAFRDIRQRRLTEDALRKATEQLHRSQRLEGLGRLAGGVAHDFNNLLTVINGYCVLLLHGKRLDEVSSLQIQKVLNAGQRATKLTGQLLAFGRGQLLKAEIIDLNAIVVEMGSLLLRVIGEHIEVRTMLFDGLDRVQVDPTQVEQIVMNLATNGRDAMPDGGVLVIQTSNVIFTEHDVEQRREIQPGAYVRLAVTDTGVGFDPKITDSLFEPFFTTKAKGKGTGLGLATVYGVVKQSTGYIYASSEPGHGATFEVFLPAVAPAQNTRDSRVANVNQTHGLFLSGEGTILLVEDEEPLRAMASSVLEEAGYTVLQAADGEEALQVSNDYVGPLDLLITDVIMPKMGGRLLAEQLVTARRGLQVIFMTGYADDEVLRHEFFDGKIELLQKPFSPSDLSTRVHQVFEQRRRRHALG